MKQKQPSTRCMTVKQQIATLSDAATFVRMLSEPSYTNNAVPTVCKLTFELDNRLFPIWQKFNVTQALN